MNNYITQNIIGPVNLPPGPDRYSDLLSGGPTNFISNVIKLLIVIAGIYALFNLVLAGYAFMSAGDDPKKVAGAWSKIWQTILGLTVSAGSLILAAIFGQLIFGDPNALLRLRVFGPN